jgi:hypothetical protein
LALASTSRQFLAFLIMTSILIYHLLLLVINLEPVLVSIDKVLVHALPGLGMIPKSVDVP